VGDMVPDQTKTWAMLEEEGKEELS
jgi:hypothetical protein